MIKQNKQEQVGKRSKVLKKCSNGVEVDGKEDKQNWSTEREDGKCIDCGKQRRNKQEQNLRSGKLQKYDHVQICEEYEQVSQGEKKQLEYLENQAKDIVVDERDHVGLQYKIRNKLHDAELTHHKYACIGQQPYIPYDLGTLKSKIKNIWSLI